MCRPDATMPPPSEEKIPYPKILRPWINAYRSSPKLYVTSQKIDIGFSIVCAVIFSIIRIFFRHVLYSFGWPVNASDTNFSAACMTSFCHGMLIVPGLAATLLSQKYVPSGKMSDHPEWYQDAVHSIMSFCTGYMIYDSIMGYVVEAWQPGVGPVLTMADCQYLIHHILTSLYMLSSRYVKAGFMSALILMFLGEFTSPLMNPYLLLEKAMEQAAFKESTWIPLAFACIEKLFAFVYFIFRTFLGPAAAAHLTWDLLFTKRGRGNVPVWLSLSWMPMCWGVLFGSIPWIFSCLDILKRGPFVGGAGDEL